MFKLVAVALFAAGCASGLGIGTQKPVVTLVGQDVAGVDASGATAKLVVRVENPNPMDVNLVMISWNALLDGKPVAQGGAEQTLKVPNHGGGEMTVPVRVAWKPEMIAGRESVPYQIHLELSFAMPSGVLAFPVDAHGTFPVPR
jgi:LEA14-like dessication related protein